MKKVTTFLSTCAVLLSLASCTTPQSLGNAAAAQNDQHKFMDGVAVGGGTNNVQLGQHGPSYTNGNNANVETAEDRSLAIGKIRDGKKRNKSLYTFIEEWYGTPYRFGGTSKIGIDCSAFTRQLYTDVYNLDLDRTSREQFQNALSVDRQQLREGDLVFFKIHSKNITHVGVYLYDGKFVHASVSQGVVISDLSDAYWSRYFAGAGRVG
ncbi:MAG: NlpC/P60 family protein [Edaphocola sp.]